MNLGNALQLLGARESGTIFALPTYAFVGGVLVVIGIGLARYTGLAGAPLELHPVQVAPADSITQFAYVWLLLRASGPSRAATFVALRGLEAAVILAGTLPMVARTLAPLSRYAGSASQGARLQTSEGARDRCRHRRNPGQRR